MLDSNISRGFFILLVIFLIGLLSGATLQKWFMSNSVKRNIFSIRQQAVSQGYGEFFVNKDYEADFRWKDPKTICSSKESEISDELENQKTAD